MTTCIKMLKREKVKAQKIISSRLGLKETVRCEQRINLKKQILQYREPVVEGENPSQICFPEEIWEQIFETVVADVDSVRNCYNTCRLFRYFLEPQRDLIFFRKVLPILFSGKYVHINDLLNCRRASKSMCTWVDNFLESRESWKKLQGGQKEFLSMHVPSVNHSVKLDANNIHGGMPNHPNRNPFVGRSVIASLISESSTENNLKACGKYIWYLSLKSSRFEAVMISLCHCKNLKRLQIGPLVDDQFCLGSISVSLPCLTSLVLASDFVTRTTKYEEPNDHFLRFQDSLVRKLSDQLEELRVIKWNREYHLLSWSKLRILQIERCDSLACLKSLNGMSAVKLKRLSLSFKGNDSKHFRFLLPLLQTIYRFGQLEELLLEFDCQWIISEEEVTALLLSGACPCSTSLKRLHVRTGFFDTITYSFLLYFPFLKHLHISYGCEELDSEEIITDTEGWFESFGSYIEQLIQQEMYMQTKLKRKNELLEIRKYIYTKRDKLYKSNVWEALPFLGCIRITEFWRSLGNKFVQTTDYFRNT